MKLALSFQLAGRQQTLVSIPHSAGVADIPRNMVSCYVGAEIRTQALTLHCGDISVASLPGLVSTEASVRICSRYSVFVLAELDHSERTQLFS